MPCLNSEFDRDYRCMLYLLHREVSSYLLEEVCVQPPRVHSLHFLDFNGKKTARYPRFAGTSSQLPFFTPSQQWLPIQLNWYQLLPNNYNHLLPNNHNHLLPNNHTRNSVDVLHDPLQCSILLQRMYLVI
jgi:hypothetical protein